MKKSLSADPASDTIDREARVREAAYFEYQRKGCVDGRALDDWLAAEAQVGAKAAVRQRTRGPAPGHPERRRAPATR